MLGAIIQARINSTRLPQKVIKEIEGKTVLEHVINRVKRIRNCLKVILATTDRKEDNALEKVAKKLNISVFRGSENDVLDRYFQTAKLFKIDPIVRITADCPLLDSEIAEEVISFYLKGSYDYINNTNPPTFPDGLDVEIFSFKALEKSWREAELLSEREHVTLYITKHPEMFKIGNVFNKKNLGHLRITLDEPEDLILIGKIYQELYPKNKFFGLKEVIKLFERKPELIKINQDIKRNEGFLKSLREDEEIN